MLNIDNNEINKKRTKVIACRLNKNEYNKLQLWKQENNIKTNSVAIRYALMEVINNDL